jgi:hypothetical protein
MFNVLRPRFARQNARQNQDSRPADAGLGNCLWPCARWPVSIGTEVVVQCSKSRSTPVDSNLIAKSSPLSYNIDIFSVLYLARELGL